MSAPVPETPEPEEIPDHSPPPAAPSAASTAAMLGDAPNPPAPRERQISDDRAEVIENRVRRGEVDFAIGPSGDRHSELEFEHIVDDPYFAVFPRTHPLAQSRTVTLKRFSGYPLVLMRTGLNMRQVLDDAAAAAGLTLRPAHEVYHHDTLTGIVAAGLGIGAMPSLTVSMVRHPQLAMARITDPKIVRAIGILKRRGEPLMPAAQMLADATRLHLVAAAIWIGSVASPKSERSRSEYAPGCVSGGMDVLS